jgi:PAS domain S-box-containing protein
MYGSRAPERLDAMAADLTSSAPSTAEALKAASERLAQDLDAMTRLHRLSTRFVRAGALPKAVLEEIVDVAISITHADQGNIQLLDPATRKLKVAAYRGHEKWWLDFFESVAEGKGASCGAALQQGGRVVVEDVTESPVFVGTPALEIQLRAGIRAVQSTPLFGSSGDLVGMISTHYRTPHRPDERDLRLLDLLARQAADMIERVRSEEALRASQERFRLLVQSLKDYAIYMLAPDGTVTSWNVAAERFYGYREDEIVGRHRSVFFPKQRGEERVDWDLERALKEGWQHEEGWRIRKDGSRFFADVLITAVRDDSGRLHGFANVTRDVTDRRRSEAALRESEERLRLAQQVARAGSFSWDIQSGVNTWTPELEALYGLPPGGFGRTEAAFEQLVHPEDRAQVLRWVERAFETGAPSEGEWRVIWPDGSVHWIAGRWQVLKDGFCKPVRMTGINFDITDRKRAEELRVSEAALREADRQKNHFLGMLSHELRNPLAPIRNSSYILRHAEPGSEQGRRAQEVIERQTEHLTRLVDDLLDVTRVARGRIELRRARVDLGDVVLHAADDFRVLLHDRGVRFEVVVPEEKLWIDGDATRLTQVIGNLLHNAAKFTRRGDEVDLLLGAVDGQAEIRVRDTGAGVDPSLLPSIFEAFVQGDRTLARSEGGLGLGLALVKGITELHGGSVRADSNGNGEGTEFVIRLPLLAAPHAESTQAPPAGRRSGARRVLVVDDNTDAAETLAAVVEMLGHAVEVAYDGPSAIEKVRANPPDVVLCDIGLPGMSGYDVARRLRASGVKGIQLIAVSGYARPEDVTRAVQAGFNEHVAKPCGLEQIERLLA